MRCFKTLTHDVEVKVQFQVNFSYHQSFLTLMQLLNRRLDGWLLELQQLTMKRGSHQ